MDFNSDVADWIDRYLGRYAERDANGCAEMYHPNARIDSPSGPPLQGRQEIRDAHVAWFDEGEENKSMEILSAGMEQNLGYVLVRFAADLPRPNGGPGLRATGTSLNVMVRKAGTTDWQILLSSMTEDPDDTPRG